MFVAGRIAAGWLADRPSISVISINATALVTGSLVNIAFPYSTNYYLLVAEAALFGFCMGKCYIILDSLHDKNNITTSLDCAIEYFQCEALLIGVIINVLSSLFSATWTSLRPIVLVELLGLERLTNAFGLLAMFQGLAFCIGSPIAGLYKSS